MTARSGSLALAVLLLLPAFPAAALTLGFGSLPSAQGWTLSSSPGVVEGDVYSVDGTTLTLDTIGLGAAHASYGQKAWFRRCPSRSCSARACSRTRR
jgi:hypothetical protein